MRRLLLVLIMIGLAVLPTVASRAQGTTYTVQPGDNLYRIALKFGTTVAAIQQANGIANSNLIFVGQVLNISGATGGPVPTAQPGGGGTPPPPQPLSGFELGGQAANLSRTQQTS